jgi:hypothetical protein
MDVASSRGHVTSNGALPCAVQKRTYYNSESRRRPAAGQACFIRTNDRAMHVPVDLFVGRSNTRSGILSYLFVHSLFPRTEKYVRQREYIQGGKNGVTEKKRTCGWAWRCMWRDEIARIAGHLWFALCKDGVGMMTRLWPIIHQVYTYYVCSPSSLLICTYVSSLCSFLKIMGAEHVHLS